jgi:hypothetical protein
MALSFSVVAIPSGSKVNEGVRLHIVTVTLDAAYVTGGGYAITAANLGFDQSIKACKGGMVNGLGVYGHFNPSTSKLVLRWTGASGSAVFAELGTNESSIDGKTIELWCFGN